MKERSVSDKARLMVTIECPECKGVALMFNAEHRTLYCTRCKGLWEAPTVTLTPIGRLYEGRGYEP